MKKCSSCGNLYHDESTFCPACGSVSATVLLNENGQQPDFTPTIPVPPVDPSGLPGAAFGGYRQPQQQQPPQQQQQKQQPPQQQPPQQSADRPAGGAPKARQKKSGCGAGITVAAVVVCVLIVIGAINNNKNKARDEATTSIFEGLTFDWELTTKNEPAAAFTTGEVRDGCYVNEWADLKLQVADFQQVPPSEYAEDESPAFKVGYWGKGDSRVVQISFVLNHALSFHSEDEKEIFRQFSESYFSADGYEAFELQTPQYFFVNGKPYYGARNKMIDSDYEVVLMVRVIGKHVCTISAAGTRAQNDALLASFTGCD